MVTARRLTQCHAGPGGWKGARELCLRSTVTNDPTFEQDDRNLNTNVRLASTLRFNQIVSADAHVASQRTVIRRPARIRVLADDQVLFQTNSLTKSDQPESLDLDLTNRRSLQLEVDYGENYDVGDHVVWGEAMLIR